MKRMNFLTVELLAVDQPALEGGKLSIVGGFESWYWAWARCLIWAPHF